MAYYFTTEADPGAPPSVPTGLVASTINSNQIDLIWNDVANETSYTLFRNTSNNTDSATNITGLSVNQTNYSDTLLICGVYYYWVKAYNSVGESGYSTTAIIETCPPGIFYRYPQHQATNIPVRTNIIISLQDNTQVVSNSIVIKVENDTALSNGVFLIGYNGANSIITANLSNGFDIIIDPEVNMPYSTIIDIIIKASDTNNNWMTPMSYYFTTEADPGTPPPVPTGLAATTINSNQIDLIWNDVANETSYTLFRSSVSSDTNTINFQIGRGINVTNYDDTGLTSGTTYYYRVKAYNSGGGSSYSAVASDTTWDIPPAQPQGLIAVAVSPNQIDLSWNDLSNETSYTLFYCVGGDTNIVVKVDGNGGTGTDNTNYSDTGLSQNTLYYYSVKAYNSGGSSKYSEVVSATTPIPNQPPEISGVTAASQLLDGSQVVVIIVTGSDANNEYCSLVPAECLYSTNKINWIPMTLYGSVSNLFTSLPASLNFYWNAGADLPGKEYTDVWIRLMVNDGLANSEPVTNNISFKVDTLMPVGALCITPPDGATNYGREVELSASSVTDAGGLMYQFQIADNTDFDSAIESEWLLSPVWTVEDLKWDKTYYWRVIVKDEFGNESEYSVFQEFHNAFPPVDFSKDNLRIIPNYIGPGDEKGVQIHLWVESEKPDKLYRVRVLSLSGRRTVRDLRDIPYAALNDNDGYAWDVTDEHGKLLPSGVYTVYVTGGRKPYKKNFYHRK